MLILRNGGRDLMPHVALQPLKRLKRSDSQHKWSYFGCSMSVELGKNTIEIWLLSVDTLHPRLQTSLTGRPDFLPSCFDL